MRRRQSKVGQAARAARIRMAAMAVATAWLTLAPASAGAQAPPDTLAAADSLFQAGEWQGAATAYEAVLRSGASRGAGRAYARLATAYYRLERWDDAIRAWEQAEAHGVPAGIARYNAASAAARAGRADEAFAWLERSIEAGFTSTGTLDSDEDFAALRDDARFAAVRAKMVAAHPCNRPECRAFDFWVGAWDVFNPQGQQVGTNTITRTVQGCMLHEEWHSARGGTGESVNYYHPGKGKWVQHWTDASGGVIEMEGGLEDGAMVLVGKNYAKDGSYELIRGRWTPLEDGRVRQFFEQSKDEGKTWYTWFDGTYVRRE